MLKGNPPWAIGSVQKLISAGLPLAGNPRKPLHVVTGHRYLLMLGEDAHELRDVIPVGTCEIMEEDPNSRREVLRGVAMDHPLKGYEPSITFGGFARHAPEPLDQ